MSIINKGSYLFVEFYGQFSVETGKQCVDRMAEACGRLGHSKVLLDCRKMTGKLSVLDRFQVAEYGATKKKQIRRFALLNREEVVLPDNFAENVAVNRGMNMKTFTDFNKAEIWVSESISNKPDSGDGE